MIYSLLTRLALFAYLLLFPAVGLLVAYIGFCDPDTCWHLALGKWMFEHRALPQVDPFSSNILHFAFLVPGMPLMQHEWLSDIWLFSIYRAFGYVGLLACIALLSVTSLAIIPAAILARNRVPRIVATGFIVLITCAAAFRLWVRPEQFSFLFMSAVILVNDVLEQACRRQGGICLVLNVFIMFIMMLWANCHVLFVLGIIYLLAYYALALVQSLLTRKGNFSFSRVAMTLIAAFLGTLINPWGVYIWVYICRLLISRDTYANKENGAMTSLDLHNPTFVPLVTVLVLYWAIDFLWVRKDKSDSLKQILPTTLCLGATVAILTYRRLTPLALLVMIAAVSKLFQNGGSAGASNFVFNLLSNTERFLQEHGIPGGGKSVLLGLSLCGSACVLAASYLVPPELPSSSRLFRPPYKAMHYLEAHRPEGRMFNDSKFGSMITWDMKRPPDIFIDGRFDSYDRDLIDDYNKMRLCEDGWRRLIDKYKIDWVFFAPETPIAVKLSRVSNWKTCYSDADAVVLARTSLKAR